MKNLILITLAAMTLGCGFHKNYDHEADVLIYGATPSGIMAAITIQQSGHSVIIVEPSRWVGGILGSGIKPTDDLPNFKAIGGSTKELILQLGVRSEDSSLTYEKVRKLNREISPKHVREDFLKLLEKYNVPVIYDHRISRTIKYKNEIKEVFFDLAPYDQNGCPMEETEKYDNINIKAKIYIDASYDGELMVRSGVSNRIGRESTMDYGESLAGVRPYDNITPISPFIIADDPHSGLLPLVENDHGKQQGAGDQYTQAYNFRFYVTTDPERRVEITVPKDYNPLDFELVGRYVDYLKETFKDNEELNKRLGWIFPGWRNSGDYNYHRGSLITTVPLGINHIYSGGDFATKARIWKAYQNYFRGLYFFMSSDLRVPEDFREKIKSMGLDGFHHPETNGWPHQLYIRVSRRLMGLYTITEHDVYNKTHVEDPIGLAQYGIDTYPARRTWFERNDSIFVAIEGNMFVGGAKGPTNTPYPIPYRAIIPQKYECLNLLVPVLFSSTHLGYASARMEPTFMIVGESAGIAAIHALEEKVPVQDIDMERYINKLKEIGQVLYWN